MYNWRPFYDEVSPDFVSAIKLLAHIEKYTLSGGYPDYLEQSQQWQEDLSAEIQGLQLFYGNKNFELKLEDVYVKSKLILVNSVIADYLKQRRELGGRLAEFGVSHRHYFEMLFRELIVNSRAAKKVIWEKREIWQLFSGGDGLLMNSWYAIVSVASQLTKKFSRASHRKIAVALKSEDSNQFVEQYLRGIQIPQSKVV